MAKQTKKVLREKKLDLIEGGKATTRAKDRVKMEGTCNKKNTVISQTNDNGNTETINWPKNIGDCGDWLVIQCLDARKQPIRGTDVWLESGKSLKSYQSPPNAQSIVFYCPDFKKGGKCVIEIDRD